MKDGDPECIVLQGSATNQRIREMGVELSQAKPSPLSTFEKGMAQPHPLDHLNAAHKAMNPRP